MACILRWRNSSGVEISNRFRHVANEFHRHVDLRGGRVGRRRSVLRGFLVRGRGDRANREADHQAGQAPVHHRHRRGPIRLAPGVLPVFEKRIMLADKHPGMLAHELSDYLFARSTGHIGSLMTLTRRPTAALARRGEGRTPRWRSASRCLPNRRRQRARAATRSTRRIVVSTLVPHVGHRRADP